MMVWWQIGPQAQLPLLIVKGEDRGDTALTKSKKLYGIDSQLVLDPGHTKDVKNVPTCIVLRMKLEPRHITARPSVSIM